MGEGKGGDGDGSVFVDDLWSAWVNLVKDDAVGEVSTKVVDLWLEYALEILGAVDVEVLDASEQSEGGEHADESKDVVAVQVCEEDGLQMGEAEA